MLYDSYAPIYDLIGQAAFGQELAQRVLAAGPSPQRVLDLACGTGAAALVFAAHGCAVVGVDCARAMLAIARARARDRGLAVAFVEADMRDLDALKAQQLGFDLAVCFYDSLNYVLEDDGLAQVCAAVAGLLEPGGRFVFDLNTEAEFATWDETDQIVYDGRDCLVYNRLDYDRTQRRASGRIGWFVRELDRWQRGEEHHHERAWRDEEIVAALRAAGLELTARLTPQWQSAQRDAPRIVYVAGRQ